VDVSWGDPALGWRESKGHFQLIADPEFGLSLELPFHFTLSGHFRAGLGGLLTGLPVSEFGGGIGTHF
jgi:hypothetical protein